MDGKRIAILALEAVALLAAISCSNAHIYTKFGYSGSIAPDKWGSLNQEYATCSSGKQQSPIDIVKNSTEADGSLKPLTRDYKEGNATVVNTGHNIMLKYDSEIGSLDIDGKSYSLRQMHWHVPSEHTIDGERFAAELHLVHVSKDNNIAVVGILYKLGDADPFFAKVENKVKELAQDKCSDDQESHNVIGNLDPKQVRKNTRKYYRYVGSLTTPPCTEGVIWNIMGKVREMSKDQVQSLQTPLGQEYQSNFRPAQGLNGRKVKLYKDEGKDGADKEDDDN